MEVSSWFFSSHFDFSVHYRVNFALLQLHPLTRAMDYELPNKSCGRTVSTSSCCLDMVLQLQLDHDRPFFYSLSLDSFLFLFSFFFFFFSVSSVGLLLCRWTPTSVSSTAAGNDRRQSNQSLGLPRSALQHMN